MKSYKGYNYFKDYDGLWKVIIDGDEFIVALDDSKLSGKREIISKFNNEKSCRKLIDFLADE